MESNADDIATEATKREQKPGVSVGGARMLFEKAISSQAPSFPTQRWEPPAYEEIAPFFPHYRIDRIIGRGGMGAVYGGLDTRLGRRVAIKILPPELGDQQGFMERFRREAQSLAQLDDTHIVHIYEMGETSGGYLFFVMEFVDGTDLLAILDEHKSKKTTLCRDRTLNIFNQVCLAVQCAHQRGIIHRDLKPANILIAEQDTVKVADFGLARPIDPDATQAQVTTAGELIGTREYMAPEILNGTEFDHKADIYALGILLYQMLTGEIPRGAFRRLPGKHRLDKRLGDVVLKALQMNPDHRYSSVEQMRLALLRAKRRIASRWWRVSSLVGTALATTAAAAHHFQKSHPPPVAGPTPDVQLSDTRVESRRPFHDYGSLLATEPSIVGPAEGLIYYEPFDYPPRRIRQKPSPESSTQAGPVPGISIAAGSLKYTDAAGNKLVTQGNFGNMDAGSQALSTRDLKPISLANVKGDVLWLSLVGKQTQGTTARVFNFSMLCPDGTSKPKDSNNFPDEVFALGMPSKATAQSWHLWNRDGSGMRKFAISPISTTTPAFLLARMELNINATPKERYTLWVNPRLDQSPPEADGVSMLCEEDSFARWGEVKLLRLTSGYQMPGAVASAWDLDEIRIGTAWRDVMPYK